MTRRNRSTSGRTTVSLTWRTAFIDTAGRAVLSELSKSITALNRPMTYLNIDFIDSSAQTVLQQDWVQIKFGIAGGTTLKVNIKELSVNPNRAQCDFIATANYTTNEGELGCQCVSEVVRSGKVVQDDDGIRVELVPTDTQPRPATLTLTPSRA